MGRRDRLEVEKQRGEERRGEERRGGGSGEGVNDAPLFLSPFLTGIDMCVGLGNGTGFVT